MDNASEVVAVIREHHANWLAAQRGTAAPEDISPRDMLTNIRPELGGPGPLTVLPLMLEPDPTRTVIRPFDFAYPPAFAKDRGNRRLVVARRVLDLDEADQAQIVDRMLAAMRKRHRNVEAGLLRRYEELGDDIHHCRPTMRKNCCSAPISARNLPSSPPRCSTRASCPIRANGSGRR